MKIKGFLMKTTYVWIHTESIQSVKNMSFKNRTHILAFSCESMKNVNSPCTAF